MCVIVVAAVMSVRSFRKGVYRRRGVVFCGCLFWEKDGAWSRWETVLCMSSGKAMCVTLVNG
ncbi:hypothetical protein P3T76_008921 [Phytophthora citrophthora]|uniref:Uncharacterized protein n=1 Tax=Phytophthora citrophthora TaxID=4793 RepID=A0AAD9GI28_9STRA|nr:hypothetical protein P3T76_008892 [Phytophthora citrophthora]KAK1938818.1 hypothetical protein P3T76_008893 [Phytophthora citrophthora]KAK1938819.1 hypothetical protein P3T76_008894 [Phytophthora citrophthora]KAK1938820.1 hypothetical protein P3T76_008895 [Phytophthora citrophthora]KAK1938821.1 hypothetical protein P3T76_008896 [Phytophthora citrophthora]